MTGVNPKHVLWSCIDSLMVLAPKGWKRVELALVVTPDGLRVSELSTRGEGSNEPGPKPTLGVDQKHEALRLSEGLTDLLSVLGEQGKAVAPSKVIVERAADFCDWRMLRADGSLAWFSRVPREELDELLVTDHLFEVLLGTARAFDDLQGRFEQQVPQTTHSFSYEPVERMLRLELADGSTVAAEAQVVGQYLLDSNTWVWGWADDEAPLGSVERVRRVCAPDDRPPGLAAFWRPGFACDEGFAWALAGSMVVSIGARGLLRARLPSGPGVIFFAAMTLPKAL